MKQSTTLLDIFIPVIQHRPKIALEPDRSTCADQIPADENTDARTTQSLTSLPLKLLGSFLDESTMRQDAFYALHDLFLFKAFSENQLLNRIRANLDAEGHLISQEHHTQKSLQNLKTYKSLLIDRHKSLQSSLAYVKIRGSVSWPRATREEDIARANEAAELLQQYFDQLLERSKEMIKQCDATVEDLRNSVLIAEARKSMDLQQSLARLTVLTFWFLPISLVTGFFGMNFNELSGLSLWIYFLSSVVVLATFMLASFWRTIVPVFVHLTRLNTATIRLRSRRNKERTDNTYE